MYPENENGLAFLFDIHGTGHEFVQVGAQTLAGDKLVSAKWWSFTTGSDLKPEPEPEPKPEPKPEPDDDDD
jgi:hypothetical protein